MMKKYLLKNGGRNNGGSQVVIKAEGYKEIYSQGSSVFGPMFLDRCSVFAIEPGFLIWLNPQSIKDQAMGVERYDPTVSWCEERDDVVYSDDDDRELVAVGGSLMTRRELNELRMPDDWIIEYDVEGNRVA